MFRGASVKGGRLGAQDVEGGVEAGRVGGVAARPQDGGEAEDQGGQESAYSLICSRMTWSVTPEGKKPLRTSAREMSMSSTVPS